MERSHISVEELRSHRKGQLEVRLAGPNGTTATSSSPPTTAIRGCSPALAQAFRRDVRRSVYRVSAGPSHRISSSVSRAHVSTPNPRSTLARSPSSLGALLSVEGESPCDAPAARWRSTTRSSQSGSANRRSRSPWTRTYAPVMPGMRLEAAELFAHLVLRDGGHAAAVIETR